MDFSSLCSGKEFLELVLAHPRFNPSHPNVERFSFVKYHDCNLNPCEMPSMIHYFVLLHRMIQSRMQVKSMSYEPLDHRLVLVVATQKGGKKGVALLIGTGGFREIVSIHEPALWLEIDSIFVDSCTQERESEYSRSQSRLKSSVGIGGIWENQFTLLVYVHDDATIPINVPIDSIVATKQSGSCRKLDDVNFPNTTKLPHPPSV
jgi:hypothetical protein